MSTKSVAVKKAYPGCKIVCPVGALTCYYEVPGEGKHHIPIEELDLVYPSAPAECGDWASTFCAGSPFLLLGLDSPCAAC